MAAETLIGQCARCGGSLTIGHDCFPTVPIAAPKKWWGAIDSVCLGGCGAIVPPPYQVCDGDCYDRLTLEVNKYRARVGYGA